MNTTKEHIIDLQLELLPAYAEYILAERLEDYVRTLYAFSLELDIPLMKFFASLPEKEILRMSKEGAIEFLSAIRDRRVEQYIETSRSNWVRNQLPRISREDVIVEDISLINYARKRTMRAFLPDYTKTPAEALKVTDEIDRFILTLDATLVKTYLAIQEERLRLSNEQLQKREQQLLEAQSLSKIGSFEWDLTGSGKSSYTPEVFKIFEMEKENSLESFLNDVHADDRLKVKTALEKAMNDGEYECEYRYTRRNIQKVLYSRGKVIFDKGRAATMVGTVSDVTEKANLIRQLLENQELSKQAQALTNLGSWKWSIESDSIEWSDEMYRIYGLEPQSEKITFQRFLTFIHDDDRNRRIAEITEAVRTGNASDYIMRINPHRGSEKVLRGKGRVILDKAGKSVGMLGTCQDITNEYNLTNELRRKNEELLRKNRDLESFNFIASHDLQEPLRKIQLYSNRILGEGGERIPEPLMKYFRKITQASNRMQKMIEDFLMFYHAMNTIESVESLRLNDVVAEACVGLKNAIEEKQPSFTIRENTALTGSRKHIVQILMHLISNAVKFSRAEAKPEIEIVSGREVAADGKVYTTVSIRDNGIGFDPQYATRIFELFQRLHSHDEYSGSGIGLSLCKKIAEDHHGYITAQSQPGVGSVFTVFLPES